MRLADPIGLLGLHGGGPLDRQHPVEDDRRRLERGGELLEEPAHLAQRGRGGVGDQDGAGGAQVPLDLHRTRRQPVVNGAEVEEELGDVLEQRSAENRVGDPQHRAGGDPVQGAASRDARSGEPAQQPAPQQVLHGVWSLHEVDAAGGGRGVDDHPLPVAAVGELGHLLACRVGLGGGEPVGDGPEVRVGDQALRHLGVGMAGDDPLPRGGDVEHRRPEVRAPGDGRWVVAQPADAQGVAETPGRVDGHHQGVDPGCRRHDRSGGRDRRLAHAPGPGHHEDLGHATPQRPLSWAATSAGVTSPNR